MTIALSANTPRISYTVSQGVTRTDPYPIPFVFFTASTDIKVFVDGTARTYDASTANTTKFTVTGGNGSTGAVTTSVTGASGGSTVVITRSIPIERSTDFPSSGAFEVAKLNTELDTLITMVADSDDENSRAVRLLDNDESATLTLPLKADRAGKVLGFNSSSGNAEAVNHITTAAVTTSTVGVGGDATASVSASGNTITFALGIPTGATGATGPAGGGLAELSEDSTPQLAGDLDLVTFDIITASNRDLELAPHGTGHVTVKGNTNAGSIQFNCESNTHGQIVKSQPHSAGVTNELTLPAGGDQELVGASATQTLTNKSIAASQLTSLSGANIVATNAQNTFTKAQLASTYTAALSATSGVLDYDTYQNFIITLASGSNTLAAVTTEASQVGQTGFIIFIQPSSSSAGTISLHGDYETAGAGGASSLGLSSTNNQYDVVPYIVKADNSILLGTPQLNFG